MGAQLQALRAAADAARQSFMIPQPVKDLLAIAVTVLEAQAAELQALREDRREPCEGCGGCGGKGER